jgi:hypothetical protein
MASRPVSSTPPVVIEALGIVYAEKWRLSEHAAAAHLAHSRGLAWTALFPHTSAFQLVTFDGRVLGRVYAPNPPRFDAVRHGGFPIGTYWSLEAAAHALAREAGCLR